MSNSYFICYFREKQERFEAVAQYASTTTTVFEQSKFFDSFVLVRDLHECVQGKRSLLIRCVVHHLDIELTYKRSLNRSSSARATRVVYSYPSITSEPMRRIWYWTRAIGSQKWTTKTVDCRVFLMHGAFSECIPCASKWILQITTIACWPDGWLAGCGACSTSDKGFSSEMVVGIRKFRLLELKPILKFLSHASCETFCAGALFNANSCYLVEIDEMEIVEHSFW